MKQTIAQQLNVKKFPFKIKDDNGKLIYCENSDGYWWKREYNDNGKEIHYENSNGYWSKYEYNDNGATIYYENSDEYWEKSKINDKGKEIYYENSGGYIIDNRPKKVILSMDDIANKFGISVSNLQIKK